MLTVIGIIFEFISIGACALAVAIEASGTSKFADLKRVLPFVSIVLCTAGVFLACFGAYDSKVLTIPHSNRVHVINVIHAEHMAVIID